MKIKSHNSHSPCLRYSIAYDYDFWYTCVKRWYLQVFFFILFKILIFWVVSGVKRQKMAQNDKKLCLSCFMYLETFIIRLSFMVHLCNMMISPCIFSFFQNFHFLGCYGGKETKISPKLSVALDISGTMH